MTYRVGHHSTSDDSSAYRPAAEVHEWTEKDAPIVRVRQHLITRGWWSEEADRDWLAQVKFALKLRRKRFFCLQVRKDVLREFGAAERVLKPPISEMFADVYRNETEQLQRQRAELDAHLREYGAHYPLENFKSTT